MCCEYGKAQTTQLCPTTPQAAKLGPITYRADNLGPITCHGKPQFGLCYTLSVILLPLCPVMQNAK